MRRIVLLVGVTLVALVALTGSAGGASSPSRAVTARIQLARRQVTTGRVVRGTLVLVNRGVATVDLTRVCTPKWDVVPGRGRKAPPTMFTQECGVDPFPVKPGRTEYPFEVATAGLRAGRYRAFLVSSDRSFPEARPAPFRIVAAS
jgi:hypothetical protein